MKSVRKGDYRERVNPITYVKSDGLVELLFLPEHEPIAGHGLSTLHQQKGGQESGDQDVSISGGEVRFVGFPGDSANVPFFLLHDRLVLLGLILEAGRVRALSFFSILSILGFVGFLFLLMRSSGARYQIVRATSSPQQSEAAGVDT